MRVSWPMIVRVRGASGGLLIWKTEGSEKMRMPRIFDRHHQCDNWEPGGVGMKAPAAERNRGEQQASVVLPVNSNDVTVDPESKLSPRP